MRTRLISKGNFIARISGGTLWVSLLLLAACQPSGPKELTQGPWRATLELAETAFLPFQATLDTNEKGDITFTIHNAQERIVVDEIRQVGDSIFLYMPVFNSRIEARVASAGKLEGRWRDFSRGDDYSIPFTAVQQDAPRFAIGEKASAPLAQTWDMDFSPDNPEDHYPAIGKFTQDGDKVFGTILTETGDYRYLEGSWDANGLKLSAFDGSHAFLFQASATSDSTLEGTFYSGNHWREPFTARIDPDVTLRNPDQLTYLKPGYEKMDFSFPDMEGKTVSLGDSRFQDKVVIVQVLGSWCPNCMDETRLFGKWYREYADQGLEIVGLAFERIGDTTLAVQSIQRMAKRLEADYPILLAELTNNKEAAGKALPMLNHVLSYPTSIFIDRKGQVRHIHTGFNGPGTGASYQEYIDTYSQLIEEMLAESAMALR